jgi:Na+-translocating ferredoxin:NAD+ oxidoreductase subunit A
MHLEFLRLISYIVVIASSVQLVEMVLKKFSPALFRALGIYLPLITTNCAVLGVALFQTAREYDFLQSVTFATGGGAGFTLALVLMASVRERLQLSNIPELAQGTALSLMLAGVLSLSFMGFAGLGG